MDITLVFKACVKAIRTTNKTLGLNDYKTPFLKAPKKDENLATPKEVLRQITQLQHILMESKASYLNVVNYLSTNKTMSQADREIIDSTSEKIVSVCSTLITDYKRDLSRKKYSTQLAEHYHTIVESLERYLKTVGKMYSENKAIRVKRVIETHKVAKLELSSQSTDIKPCVTSPPPQEVNELSVDELQMFESENELLYNELNATSEEVKQMETKVVHIAELQELFTEKVLQQEQDIERISNNVVGATSNMRDANEQIRQAIQRNAGLRVWVLFFLLVMSFSLLFLDWYND